MSEWRDKVGQGDYLETVVTWAELAIAALLAVLVIVGTGALGYSLYELLTGNLTFSGESYLGIVDASLTVFIVVELFRIAVAYARHEDVIHTVMEAVLVAVARKLIIFDTHAGAEEVLMRAAALAILFVAVGFVWYVLGRGGAPVEGSAPAPGRAGSAREEAS